MTIRKTPVNSDPVEI